MCIRDRFYFERPEHAVEHVTTHVSDGTIAEVIPAVPFVRMDVGVKIAIGRGSDPVVPMHALGWFLDGRARTDAAVGAVCPAMRFGDFADDAAPNILAQSA